MTDLSPVQDDLGFDLSETKEFDECTTLGVSGYEAQHTSTFVPVLLRLLDWAAIKAKEHDRVEFDDALASQLVHAALETP